MLLSWLFAFPLGSTLAMIKLMEGAEQFPAQEVICFLSRDLAPVSSFHHLEEHWGPFIGKGFRGGGRLVSPLCDNSFFRPSHKTCALFYALGKCSSGAEQRLGTHWSRSDPSPQDSATVQAPATLHAEHHSSNPLDMAKLCFSPFIFL